jgi:hypothetical protein
MISRLIYTIHSWTIIFISVIEIYLVAVLFRKLDLSNKTAKNTKKFMHGIISES